jgi:hypothetical protein
MRERVRKRLVILYGRTAGKSGDPFARRSWGLLSTDPFNAFDSITLVCRKDSISLPVEESSRSDKAKSTLLNCNNGEIL